MNRSHVTLANINLVKSGAMLKDWLTGQADVANHDDTSVSDSGVLAVPIQKESPSKTIDIDEPKFARIVSTEVLYAKLLPKAINRSAHARVQQLSVSNG